MIDATLTTARGGAGAAGSRVASWSAPPRDPRLRGLVRRLWMADVPRAPGDLDRIVDAGVVELLFDLSPAGHRFRVGGDAFGRLPSCLVNGLKLRHVDLAFGGHQRFFGAQLASHAPRLLFGVSSEEVAGRVVDGGDLTPELRRLHAALVETTSLDRRVARLEAFLAARAAGRGLDARFALDRLLACDEIGGVRPGAPVARAAAAVGLSPRHYLRGLREWHGAGPGELLRLHRFVTAIAAMEGARSLADVAASAGYCDQAHLNREFRRFTATSPGDYLRRRNGPPGHFVP